MGRAPCCQKVGLKRGRWTAEEDEILTKYIQANGEGSWRSLPKNAGLLRCGKSCRLRWVNYLKQDLKRGNISPEEEKIIINLHANLGNRWSLIANQLSGRTDNEIKNYWNSHLSRKIDTFRRPLAPLNAELQAILERAKADAIVHVMKKGGKASKLPGGNPATRKGTSSKSKVSKPIDKPEAIAKLPTSCSDSATVVDGKHNVTAREPDETGDDSEIINDGWMPASGGVTVSPETAGPIEGIDKDVILDMSRVMDCDEILMKSHTTTRWDGDLVNISDGPTSPMSDACDGEMCTGILGPYEGTDDGILSDINDIMDWDGCLMKSRTTTWEDDLVNISGDPTSLATGAISTCIVEAHNNVNSSSNITRTSSDDVGGMNDLEWEGLLEGFDEVLAPSCESRGQMLNWLWESGMNDDHRGDQDAFGSLLNFEEENDMIMWLLS